MSTFERYLTVWVAACIVLGIALGFGFSLLIMAYVIGPISGCHINPAVTLGMLIARKINTPHAVFAWIGQVIGGIGGAAIIYGIASGRDSRVCAASRIAALAAPKP